MQEKIKIYKKLVSDYAYQLRDIRVSALVLFVFVVLAMSWSGVKAIETNYGLQKQIAQLEQENSVQQLTNNNLKLTNQYLTTDTYLDIEARKSFGLAAPGERIVVIPREVAIAHYIEPSQKVEKDASEARSQEPAYQRNFQDWIDFFLHRRPSDN